MHAPCDVTLKNFVNEQRHFCTTRDINVSIAELVI